tara:strand:+ start:7696 stop:8097 length:402 start_codon:yes stop_codon:yes gene_type:complete
MSKRTEAVAKRLEEKETPEAPRILPKVDPEKDPLRCGYLTGVTKDGQAVFEVVGSHQDIVTLAGLHSMAGKKIEANMDAASGGGWPFIAQQIQQLAGQVVSLTEVLRDLAADRAGVTREELDKLTETPPKDDE